MGRSKHLKDDRKFNGKVALKALWKCKRALLAPIIILGTIYTGVCTPTEASEIAVFYSMLYGFVIKRNLSFKIFIRAFRNGAITAATMLVMSGVAGGFGRIITMYQLPQTIGRAIANFTTNPHTGAAKDLTFAPLKTKKKACGTFRRTLPRCFFQHPPVYIQHRLHPGHLRPRHHQRTERSSQDYGQRAGGGVNHEKEGDRRRRHRLRS